MKQKEKNLNEKSSNNKWNKSQSKKLRKNLRK